MANASHNSETIPNAGSFVISFNSLVISWHTLLVERIVLMTLAEKDRLIWRKRLTEYFRETGDWSVYLLPPAIMIADLDSIDSFIDAGNGIFHYASSAFWNGKAMVLPLSERTVSAKSGLYISHENKPVMSSFEGGSVKVDDLMLVETDWVSYRIVKRRPLGFSVKTAKH